MDKQSSHYPAIATQVCSGVGWIELHRPPLNIITTAMADQITATVMRYDADPAVRVIVIHSGLERAFAAGSDVGEHDLPHLREHCRSIFSMCRALADIAGKPRFAIVNGICSGGGNELAFSCDGVIACEDTRFALPEIGIGVVSSLAAMLMAHHASQAKVLDLALTGRWIKAAEADRMGLIVKILPRATFDTDVADYLKMIASKSGPALMIGRRLLLRALGRERIAAQLDELERGIIEEAAVIPDYAEGVAAFLEKRQPRWNH